jgi:phospholipase C
MNYFGMGDLPVLHELAKHFAVCDKWYSSVPGPTWTNRFFVHSGTSKGLVTMPESITQTEFYLHYDQETIYDRLNEKKKWWRVYFGDVPQSLVLSHQRRPRNALHYRFMHRFFDDAQAPERAFPEYSFIEPNYFKGEQNDDHPPHSTMRAQRLLANVYNALRNNEDLWNSTLLVVLYDEHGGFFDHVEPPDAEPPAPFQSGDEYRFNQFGVRVPALLISPWVDAGVVTTEFDHTSLLKYLTDKWSLGTLTNRVRQANSFANVIRMTGKPRDDTPKSVDVPPLTVGILAAALPEGAAPDVSPDELAEPINDYQRSLIVFTEHLEQNETAPEARAVKLMMAGPLSEEQQAKRRVEAFLDQQSLKAAASPES